MILLPDFKAAKTPARPIRAPSDNALADYAFILMDQEGRFCNPFLTILSPDLNAGTWETHRVASHNNRVLEEFRSLGMGIYHVWYAYNGKTGPDFYKIKPLPGEQVVSKRKNSAFAESGLHELLQKQGKRKIILAGFNRSACITDTGVGGAGLGYEVTILTDGTGDCQYVMPSAIKKSPRLLREAGVALQGSGEILSRLKNKACVQTPGMAFAFT